jgi:hypothetical protein
MREKGRPFLWQTYIRLVDFIRLLQILYCWVDVSASKRRPGFDVALFQVSLCGEGVQNISHTPIPHCIDLASGSIGDVAKIRLLGYSDGNCGARSGKVTWGDAPARCRFRRSIAFRQVPCDTRHCSFSQTTLVEITRRSGTAFLRKCHDHALQKHRFGFSAFSL